MAPSQRESCSHPGVKPLSESRFCELPVTISKFLASPGNLVTYASLADLGRRLCRSQQEHSLWPGAFSLARAPGSPRLSSASSGGLLMPFASLGSRGSDMEVASWQPRWPAGHPGAAPPGPPEGVWSDCSVPFSPPVS